MKEHKAKKTKTLALHLDVLAHQVARFKPTIDNVIISMINKMVGSQKICIARYSASGTKNIGICVAAR